VIPLVDRAASHGARLALVATDGAVTYSDLLAASARTATALLAGAPDLAEARVAFLAPPTVAWVATQWGIWRAGGVAVPLATMHPPAELDYVVGDTGATIVVAHPDAVATLAPIAERHGARLLTTTCGATAPGALPDVDAARRGMIVYTSGTTSRPKGAVSTHATLAAQMRVLVDAWGWRPDDRILHVLPLHHLHGIMAALGCALWAGATCELLPRFDAETVWRRFEGPEPPSVFMAVPTIYARLVAAWESATPPARAAMAAAARRLRLMVSGSAALPVPLFERWRSITGHALLERYGTTEVGLVLSNPLVGERVPGSVGAPVPGVSVRLVDETGEEAADGVPGEIQVRGPTVFLEYWRRPEATAALRTEDGWTRTGDVAVRTGNRFRILGRASVDIIKSGGYKISALEIEHVLLGHDAIAECAVVGVPDDEWGEVVTAAVVLRPGASLTLDALRAWGRSHLAPYKLPQRLETVDALPRNALGKVTKPVLVRALAAG
jgi:malonyl-CoA/methylmalonyl-CoA synthetase